MAKYKKNNRFDVNPWTPQDEGDHYPMKKEWWCFETLFKTIEDNRKWNLKFSIAYERETPSCFFFYVLFDITNNKCVRTFSINDDINKFFHKKNEVDLKYEKNTVKGLHPNYDIHLENEKQDFKIDMKYVAKILPHWSAQDSTNGYLPIGLDHYRYGWLLNCDLTGKMLIDNESHKIEGKGYLEKAWGNWSYKHPFQKLSSFRKTVSTYGNLINWWLLHRKPKIPDRIAFTTENNPFGYDWFWSVFNNDWSIFYGNSLFFIREGPGFGVLTLFTDKNNYIDFADFDFKYNKTVYIEKYDVEYPIDITVTGRKDDKKLNVRAYSLCDPKEYIEEFNGFYRVFIIPEMPGGIEGTYFDGKKTIKLKGDCKLVQQRQASILGHNSLTIDLLKPPKGFGASLLLDSHYLKRKMFTQIQLSPKLKLKFHIEKIKTNEFVIRSNKKGLDNFHS